MTPDGRPFTRNARVYVPVNETTKINKNTRKNAIIFVDVYAYYDYFDNLYHSILLLKIR